MTTMAPADLLKRCARCWQCKPLDDFPKASRMADGRHSYCRPCMNDYRREWLKNNPAKREARRANQRRRYHARTTTQEERDERAVVARLSRHEAPSHIRPKGATEPYRPPSAVEVVDAAPFRSFLTEAFPDLTAGQIAGAARFAVSDRRLREVLHGVVPMVELDTVDRFLTAGLGRPDLLNAIYPVEL